MIKNNERERIKQILFYGPGQKTQTTECLQLRFVRKKTSADKMPFESKE